MELHFYTSYDNIQKLREGDRIQVWTKDRAEPYDIHVSFDMDKYSFHKVLSGLFEVEKINSITLAEAKKQLKLLGEIYSCPNKNL